MAYDSILNAAAIGTMLLAGGNGVAQKAAKPDVSHHPILFGDPAVEIAANTAAANHPPARKARI
ncbi:hypothetical protein FHS61_002532 [Altererythrobacter atlanticus]|uniref:Uncharacterized protein n=1 Tax=Croceibacterium atlanticum TaxID=1267766 RepID=A0A0F7KS42_9SPHN|nr:hypothetical protein [Croceibacterium atlanticum]AKH41936.1 hypothetical protein WYH_00886 [Croceibacterium atlanticum]MBB5733497.1 hypothetical protein [Croceibacterium atlanticum]